MYRGKKAGGPDFAGAAEFAFYPNKQIITGEGGMIVTDDDRIAALCDSSMRNQGIGCRPYFTPIHLQPFYRKQFGYREGDFPVTEAVRRTSVAIPFRNRITEEEVEYVAGVLEGAVREAR